MKVTVINIFNTSIGKTAILESQSGKKLKVGMKFSSETSEFSIRSISLFGKAILDAENNLFNCNVLLSKGTIDIGDVFTAESN